MIKDIMLVGVGGQGVILASNLLAQAFLQDGYDVKQSVIHGMAQRGGSVTSFVRRGEEKGARVHAPTIDPGYVDAVIAFEKLEALRFSHYLKPGGTLVYSSQEIVPTSVSALGAPYPGDIDGDLAATGANLVQVDVLGIAEQCGNPRVANVVLVGSLAARLEITPEIWHRAIKATVPRALDANLKAFDLGRKAAEIPDRT